MRENSIYMLYCGSCADSVKSALYRLQVVQAKRLKSGDAVIIAPPLGVCASPYKNRLHTAGNAPRVLRQLKNGFMLPFQKNNIIAGCVPGLFSEP